MYRTIWTNVQWNVLNYTVSPQNSEPKNLQHMLADFTKLFRNYTLKTMLTSVVKRRELIDCTIFFPKVYIRVTYFYTLLLGTNAIISNCV